MGQGKSLFLGHPEKLGGGLAVNAGLTLEALSSE